MALEKNDATLSVRLSQQGCRRMHQKVFSAIHIPFVAIVHLITDWRFVRGKRASKLLINPVNIGGKTSP
jgi:hypothetical protein